MKSEKKLFQYAFMERFARFASSDREVTAWTLRTNDIDGMLADIWTTFERLREEEFKKHSERAIQNIARRAARFKILEQKHPELQN